MASKPKKKVRNPQRHRVDMSDVLTKIVEMAGVKAEPGYPTQSDEWSKSVLPDELGGFHYVIAKVASTYDEGINHEIEVMLSKASAKVYIFKLIYDDMYQRIVEESAKIFEDDFHNIGSIGRTIEFIKEHKRACENL